MRTKIRKISGGLILAAAFLMAGAGAHAGLQDGLDAHNRGDYAAALKKFSPLAENGDAEMTPEQIGQASVQALKWQAESK